MRVKVAIDLVLDKLFTYSVPSAIEKKLAIGQLLSVPFGYREARGFALEILQDDESVGAAEEKGFKLKPISAIVDEVPFFSPALLELVKKIALYTASPIEAVLKAAVPAAVLKKNAKARELLYVEPLSAPDSHLPKKQAWVYEQIVRLKGGWLSRLIVELGTSASTIKALGEKGFLKIAPLQKRRDPLWGKRILPTKPLPLNEEQRLALDAINASLKPLVLFGVTGSGKTEVYLQAIAKVLSEGKGAIVMVPEIALTPQTVQRFASRFGNRVAVLHSALSDGERYDEWHRIRSGAACVVVGPRSAVFAPVKNLGLIVVDEEHETSYKQEELPRYHARDVAVLRGAIENAKVVLGSATPSLESWMNTKISKYDLVEMKKRAGSGTLPKVLLVNMNGSGERSGGTIFSQELLEAIKYRLERHEQTILFLNRRGYSRSMTCNSCGYSIECPECAVPYTYHRVDSCLRCHICGRWEVLPGKCPECGLSSFSFKGIGTQRAEAALKSCFKHARVLRMDRDATSRKNSHDDILGAFRRFEADILIGTQMIAKGLDFPNVTLVGVLNADSSLNMPEFRAAERTFQLVSQVAGRAGRAELPGEVFIQTYDTSQSPIFHAARGDYQKFAEEELRIRREGYFPPYCHLALVSIKSKDACMASSWAEMYAKSLSAYAKSISSVSKMLVSEAVPGLIEKSDGWYRFQVVIRADKTSSLINSWKWIISKRPPPKGLVVNIDIDAFNLI
jgi:primosomal protein N' (replication factor Y)